MDKNREAQTRERTSRLWAVVHQAKSLCSVGNRPHLLKQRHGALCRVLPEQEQQFLADTLLDSSFGMPAATASLIRA